VYIHQSIPATDTHAYHLIITLSRRLSWTTFVTSAPTTWPSWECLSMAEPRTVPVRGSAHRASDAFPRCVSCNLKWYLQVKVKASPRRRIT